MKEKKKNYSFRFIWKSKTRLILLNPWFTNGRIYHLSGRLEIKYAPNTHIILLTLSYDSLLGFVRMQKLQRSRDWRRWLLRWIEWKCFLMAVVTATKEIEIIIFILSISESVFYKMCFLCVTTTQKLLICMLWWAP